jgi:hypothetical protein
MVNFLNKINKLEEKSTTGSVTTTIEEKKKYAILSYEHNLKNVLYKKLFLDELPKQQIFSKKEEKKEIVSTSDQKIIGYSTFFNSVILILIFSIIVFLSK